MTDRHRYYSADILTGTIRDELPLQQVTVTDRLKAPATMQASIPFRHPKATRANLNTETTMPPDRMSEPGALRTPRLWSEPV